MYKKRLVICLFFCLPVVFLHENLAITHAQTAPTVQRRCGIEQPNIQPNAYLWAKIPSTISGIQTQSVPSNAKRIAPKVVVDSSQTALVTTQHHLAQNGEAIAFFTKELASQPYDNKAIKAVEVATRDGKHSALAASSNWWQLGPELRQGHFGILAYDDNYYATLVDLSWTGGALNAQNGERLPFKVNIAGALWEKPVFISPNWDYIAYINGQSYPQSLDIYSVHDKRVIWSLKLNRGVIPHVSWPMTQNAIAVINLGGADGDGQIIRIDKQGQSQILIDLSTALGREVRLFGVTFEANGTHDIGLSVQPLVNGGLYTVQYFLLNVDNGTLVDLCLSTSPGITAFGWLERGKYLTYQELDPANNTPSRAVAISASSSNYAYFYPGSDKQILEAIAWSDIN